MTSSVRVGEVLELRRRSVAVDAEESYQEIGVRSFGRGIFHKPPISGADLGSKRVFYIEPGDLVLSNVFAWEGAVALAAEQERGMIGSHRFMTFVPRDQQTSTSYLRYFFSAGPGLAWIRQASPGSAGRNRTLAVERFESLVIPLPDIDQQRQVAERLDRLYEQVDRLTTLRERRRQLLTALPPAMAHRLDLSEEDRRARCWQLTPLGEAVTQVQNAVPVEPSGAYPIAGIYSFGRGMLRRETIAGIDTKYSKLFRLEAGMLVMSRLKAWEGAISVVPIDFAGTYVSQEFPRFAIDEGRLDPDYLNALVQAPAFWGALVAQSQGLGSRRERVSADRLLRTPVWLPPLDEQRRIGALARRLDEVARRAEAVTPQAEALRAAILEETFAGLE